MIERGEEKKKRRREEEGSCSNRPQLLAFVLALRGTPATKLMLYLCDNPALLKAVKKSIGESDVSRSARHRHFMESNRRAPRKNNSRNSDVSGQSESASRRTCK